MKKKAKLLEEAAVKSCSKISAFLALQTSCPHVFLAEGCVFRNGVRMLALFAVAAAGLVQEERSGLLPAQGPLLRPAPAAPSLVTAERLTSPLVSGRERLSVGIRR